MSFGILYVIQVYIQSNFPLSTPLSANVSVLSFYPEKGVLSKLEKKHVANGVQKQRLSPMYYLVSAIAVQVVSH